MKNLSKILTFVFGFALLATGQVHAAGSVTFYHHDALGSVVASSHENGWINWNEEYQPYGEKIYDTIDNEGDSDDFFTGKNYDRELDITYFGARWYDAKQGRFLSMDPAPVVLDELHTFNRYVYSNNNPYSFIDPDGENAVTAFGGLIVETGNFVTGKGFDGGAVLGALSDGYNGEGAGFAASAYQDATEIIPVGKILGFLSKGARVIKSIGGASKSGRSTADLVQEVATRAERKIGGTGAAAGSKKHAYAKQLMDRYQRRYGGGLETEVSFKGHNPAAYGTKGSTRLDVWDPATGNVYDYKFTVNPGRGISARQQAKIRGQGPRGISNITEVNP